MSTHFVERIAVEVDGEGEAVFMIHGLGGSSNVWTPLLPELARFRIIRPDLPGSARSARAYEDQRLSIEKLAQAMLRAAASVGVERAHVVAHSLGTVVAFHLALNELSFVRSLALFGPMVAPPDSVRPGLRVRADKARSEGQSGMQEIANSLVNSTTSPETRATRPVTVALVRELLMRQPADGYARSCDALAGAKVIDVSRITCPTLLVGGDADSVAPAQEVQRIGRAIVGCEVEVLRGCGHWIPIEKPDECRFLLQRFYSRRM
ncbi:MAG TPA: alpha/beta fold hydrolase [Burkholderiaceae bacterium]|nr:alpha/beta fold hydrolase [Burkholderiaceae bacterium]